MSFTCVSALYLRGEPDCKPPREIAGVVLADLVAPAALLPHPEVRAIEGTIRAPGRGTEELFVSPSARTPADQRDGPPSSRPDALLRSDAAAMRGAPDRRDHARAPANVSRLHLVNSAGCGLARFKALVWGTRDPGFKSLRPDRHTASVCGK